MKVIKDGKVGDPKKWSREITCKAPKDSEEKGCGAVLRITRRDLKVMYWEGTHFRHYYAAVCCPQCGANIEVKRVPGTVWAKICTEKAKRNAEFDGYSDSII